jgi:hypothetical protein
MAKWSTLSDEEEEKLEREILLRVDRIKALVRCASTCKRWHRMILADPEFICSWNPKPRAPLLVSMQPWHQVSGDRLQESTTMTESSTISFPV